MRRGHVMGLIVGALALATAGAASAADMFSGFNGACLKTAGDRQAALAFADAAGWTVMPPTATPPTAPNFKLTQVDGRIGPGADKQTLIVGKGETTMAGKPVPAQMCMMVGVGAAGAADQLKSALGMEPAITMAMPNAGAGVGPMTMTMYIYRDTASGRVAMTPAELGGASGLKQPMTMVMVVSGTQTPVGMLGRFVLTP